MRRKWITAVFMAVYMTAAAVSTAASPLDVENLNKMIETLPERNDMSAEDEESVKTLKEAVALYNSLSNAEKLQIDNYEKLEDDYNWAKMVGVMAEESEEDMSTEDERTAAENQRELVISADNETNATEYVFEITEDKESASVVMRYTTDLNGDRNGDMPSRIVLTSPEGKTYAVTNASGSLKDEGMYIIFTWEQKFAQIDIAQAPLGKWKISTSDPVAFSVMPYAGPKYDITPVTEEGQDAGELAGTPSPEEEEEGDSGNNIQLILVGILAVVLFVVMKKIGVIGGKNDDEEEDDDEEDSGKKKKKKKKGFKEPKPMSDEEYIENMKKEYSRRKKEEESEQDDEYSDEGFDDEEDDDDDDEGYTEYVETGNTGLLQKDKKPSENGGGLREDDDDNGLDADLLDD